MYYYLPGGYPAETHQLKKCKRDEICKSEDNRLKWPYPHDWYLYSYVLTIFIVVTWIKPISYKMIFIIMFTLTFILTYIIYPKTIGSVWCWSTSFIAPVIVVIGWVVIRKLPNSQILV